MKNVFFETIENPKKRFELQRAKTKMFLTIKGEIVFPSHQRKESVSL